MSNENLIASMAEGCFGYGSWRGNHWFIGPEQGMRENEKLVARAHAWNRKDLDDCKQFHRRLGECKWHGQTDSSVPFKAQKRQRTWQKGIAFTLGFLGTEATPEKIWEYQRSEWGKTDGDTCVIELSGLPAHSHAVAMALDQEVLERRIEKIRQKFLERAPKTVVIYGAGRRGNCDRMWNSFSGTYPVTEIGPFRVRSCDGSLIVRAPHPVAPITGNTIEAWRSLGEWSRSMT